jgi:hypothetical protein
VFIKFKNLIACLSRFGRNRFGVEATGSKQKEEKAQL